MTPSDKKPKQSILPKMRRVIIESPFKATAERSIEQHREYLKHCISDCVKRGENPYASHLVLTDILDDDNPLERGLGIKCGWEWAEFADAIAAYVDLGCSQGMIDSIKHYQSIGKIIERRTIDANLVRAILEY